MVNLQKLHLSLFELSYFKVEKFYLAEELILLLAPDALTLGHLLPQPHCLVLQLSDLAFGVLISGDVLRVVIDIFLGVLACVSVWVIVVSLGRYHVWSVIFEYNQEY